jgi:hypothetical protein
MEEEILEIVRLSDVKARTYAEWLKAPREKCEVDDCERPQKYGKLVCAYHLKQMHKGIRVHK